MREVLWEYGMVLDVDLAHVPSWAMPSEPAAMLRRKAVPRVSGLTLPLANSQTVCGR